MFVTFDLTYWSETEWKRGKFQKNPVIGIFLATMKEKGYKEGGKFLFWEFFRPSDERAAVVNVGSGGRPNYNPEFTAWPLPITQYL